MFFIFCPAEDTAGFFVVQTGTKLTLYKQAENVYNNDWSAMGNTV